MAEKTATVDKPAEAVEILSGNEAIAIRRPAAMSVRSGATDCPNETTSTPPELLIRSTSADPSKPMIPNRSSLPPFRASRRT